MVWRFEIDIDSGTELEGWFGDMYGSGYIERGFLVFFLLYEYVVRTD